MSKEDTTSVPPETTTETESQHYEVAVGIVMAMQEDVSGTLGVLLTLAEVALANSPGLKAYKDQIKREIQLMRNRFQDNVYYNLGVQDQWHSPGNVYMAGEMPETLHNS